MVWKWHIWGEKIKLVGHKNWVHLCALEEFEKMGYLALNNFREFVLLKFPCNILVLKLSLSYLLLTVGLMLVY